jgi:peptide chain release factor 1
MFKKLDDVEKKFNELTEQLSNPDIISNQNQFQAIAKERAHLSELMDTYTLYKATTKELEDNRELMNSEDDKELREMAAAEIPALETQIEELEQKMKIQLLPKDPYDDKNIILEIRAGTGGDEAALFAADLFRMYSRYAEQKNWKVEVLEQNATGLGGFKELIAVISGDRVYSELKFESGVHRVQRVPSTETQGRVHTSACTVAVMPEAEDIDIHVEESDLRIDVYRASGPGGQGVNRTDSAVRITHIPSGTVVACQDERSQHKNKARAMKILKSRILEMESAKQAEERSATRKSMVKTGDRSEKIRTYNFPQNRLTDHRINLTLHNLLLILDGRLGDVLEPLLTQFQMDSLKESMDDKQ